MKHKGEDCYAINKVELLAALQSGAVLWTSKFGPHVWDSQRRELHPRRDTVRRLIREGILVESNDANQVQRSCGMSTYKLAGSK